MFHLLPALQELAPLLESGTGVRVAAKMSEKQQNATFDLGKKLLENGHFADAVDVFKLLCSQNSSNVSFLTSLATALNLNQQHQESLIPARLAFKTYPWDPHVIRTLASCLISAARSEDLWELFSHVLYVVQRFPDAKEMQNLANELNHSVSNVAQAA